MAGSFNLARHRRGAAAALWYVVPQFIGFVVFLIAGLAETRRLPFDLPEAESELVAGFHTEYSGMKFGMFLVGEYVGDHADLGAHRDAVLRRLAGAVAAAASSGSSSRPSSSSRFFILVRGTFPRPRYDQLMALGWKVMLPLSLLNLLITGAIVVAGGVTMRDRRSCADAGRRTRRYHRRGHRPPRAARPVARAALRPHRVVPCRHRRRHQPRLAQPRHRPVPGGDGLPAAALPRAHHPVARPRRRGALRRLLPVRGGLPGRLHRPAGDRATRTAAATRSGSASTSRAASSAASARRRAPPTPSSSRPTSR